MKLLIYGLQNSGATLAAAFAGQRPNSVALLDLWSMYPAPDYIGAHDICVKATITEAYPLDKHIASFRPDCTILVMRHPVDNYASLYRKTFRNHDGTIERKFEIAEEMFSQRNRFDAFFCFEDFVQGAVEVKMALDRLGWSVPSDSSDFPRSPYDMETFNWMYARDLYGRVEWGLGNARIEPLSRARVSRTYDAAAEAFCKMHCPEMLLFFEARSDTGGGTRLSAAPEENDLLEPALFLRKLNTFYESAMSGGQIELAERISADMYKVAPDATIAWTARARVLERQGRTQEATAWLEALAGTHPGGILCLARHFLRTGAPSCALERARVVLTTEPKNQDALECCAQASLHLGDFNAAYTTANAVLQVTPRRLSSRQLRARASYKLGRLDAAEEDYRFCLSVDPSFAPARQGLLEMGRDPG